MSLINPGLNLVDDSILVITISCCWALLDWTAGIFAKKYFKYHLAIKNQTLQQKLQQQQVVQLNDQIVPTKEELSVNKDSGVHYRGGAGGVSASSASSAPSASEPESFRGEQPIPSSEKENKSTETPPKKIDSKKDTLEDDEVQARKFHRSVWKALNYLLLVISGCYAISSQEWGWDVSRYFEDIQHKIALPVRFHFLTEIAHYVYATIIIKTEPKQSDFYPMLFHHIATLILLSFSYTLSYDRIGIMVLLTTDLSDPFLEVAKITNYLKVKPLSDHLFTLFAIVFLLTRLVVYPMVVLYPAVYHPSVLYGDLCVLLLTFLQIIFIYWSSIIIGIAVNLISGGGLVDSREEE